MPPSARRTHRALPATLLAASIAVVGGALLFQYVGGLVPCELCLYERWPYYAAIVLSAAALAVGRRGLAAAVMGLCALFFLANVGLGFYHVGVEQHWFAGPTACTAPQMNATSIEALKAQLLGQKPVRCDEVQWSLFGVSLAGWNLVASLALAAFCAAALRRLALVRRRS
jgi:disulfide bond formation protein DsbB